MHLLFVVDIDPERDPRVRRHLDEVMSLGATVEILLVRRRRIGGLRALCHPRALGFLIASLRDHGGAGLAFIRRIRPRLGPRYRLRWRVFEHSLLGLNLLLGLALGFRSARGRRFDAVVANDLYCGIAGYIVAKQAGVPLIYDSHELQLFRNLRNSYTRIFLAYCFEHRIADYAQAIFVVSRPIASIYRWMYRSPNCRVIENRSEVAARYVGHGAMWAAGRKRLSFIYFGSLQTGRGLSYLPLIHAQTDGQIHLFAPNDSADNLARLVGLAPADWLRGHAALSDMAQATRFVGDDAIVFSLCLIEDICLNYRFALPNKLFESLANGIPIICFKGTYVGVVVSVHRLGIVLSEQELRDGHLPSLIEAFEWTDFLADVDKFLARRRQGLTYTAYWRDDFGLSAAECHSAGMSNSLSAMSNAGSGASTL